MTDTNVLLDELACRKVLGRYGPSLDWRSPELLASTVWPDALIDYGFFKGSGAEYIGVFMEIERAADRPFHMLVCDRVEVTGKDAIAESVGIALTLEKNADGTPAARQYWGRYLDRLEKRGGEWRIIHRQYIVHGVFDVRIPNIQMGALEGLAVAQNLTTDHPAYPHVRPA